MLISSNMKHVTAETRKGVNHPKEDHWCLLANGEEEKPYLFCKQITNPEVSNNNN